MPKGGECILKTKNWMMTLALTVILLIFTACSSGNVAEEHHTPIIEENLEIAEDYYGHIDETAETYPPEADLPEIVNPSIPPITIEAAAGIFSALQAAWDADGGAMWGVRLHMPVAIVCNDTFVQFSSHSTYPFLYSVRQYVGDFAVYVHEGDGRRHLPIYSIRNWGEQRWLFVMWDFLHTDFYYNDVRIYDTRMGTAALDRHLMIMVHAIFHAWQPSIMNVHGASFSALPSSTEARISFEMELNALLQAINSDGEERIAIVRDALSVRHARREAFNSPAAENLIEVSEGTAVYTELRLLFNREEIIAMLQNWPKLIAQHESNFYAAIQFAYISGALYGMLLDDFGVAWRPLVGPYTDFGQMLKEAAGITELLPQDEIDMERYGYREIRERLTERPDS